MHVILVEYIVRVSSVSNPLLTRSILLLVLLLCSFSSFFLSFFLSVFLSFFLLLFLTRIYAWNWANGPLIIRLKPEKLVCVNSLVEILLLSFFLLFSSSRDFRLGTVPTATHHTSEGGMFRLCEQSCGNVALRPTSVVVKKSCSTCWERFPTVTVRLLSRPFARAKDGGAGGGGGEEIRLK